LSFAQIDCTTTEAFLLCFGENLQIAQIDRFNFQLRKIISLSIEKIDIQLWNFRSCITLGNNEVGVIGEVSNNLLILKMDQESAYCRS